MKMPFGKHKGQEIHTIPPDYLRWCRDNVANLNGYLLRAVLAGLEGEPFEPPTVEERIDKGIQEMLERLRQRDSAC